MTDEYRDRDKKDGNRDRRPQKGGYGGDRKPYGNRNGGGGRGPGGRSGGDRRPRDREGGDRSRSGGYNGRGGDRKPYGNRDGGNDRRPRDRDGNGGSFNKDHRDRREGDGGRRPYGNRDDRGHGPRDNDRNGGDRPQYRRDDGERRPRGSFDKGRGGDRKPYGNRDGGRGRGPRDGDRRPRYEDRGDRPRYRDNDRRDGERRDDAPQEPVEPKLTIPSTPEKILFKGIDCEVNGRTDLAMVLYLNGAAQLSKGCESNMQRMLREAGSKEFGTIRGRLAKNCSDDLLVSYDYLCADISGGYDRSFIDSAAESGNPLAIYYKIRLGEVEGDDPCIDVFASKILEREDMVVDGLKLLARRKGSEKAAEYLKANDERRKLRLSIRETFVKARKGDSGSMKRLEKLTETFPEAGFLRGFLNFSDEEDQIQYLRDGMSEFGSTVLSMAPELGLKETGFGKYLAAKRLQINGEEWIQPMIGAVMAGSEEAFDELGPVQNRRDVRKSLSSFYLMKGDAMGLVRGYDGEDATYLDEYCAGDVNKVLEVGRLMGGVREIDWLKRGYLAGMEGCREAILRMADDTERHCKQLVYTLHDVGAEMEAAKLYIAMGDDPSLPAVKWLRKVCADEEAKEYLRQQFEARGDIQTFESIFEDDGYRSKGAAGKGGRPKGRSGGFGNKGFKGRR